MLIAVGSNSYSLCSQHFKKMIYFYDPLKYKLVSSGLIETKSKHNSTVNKILHNCPAISDSTAASTTQHSTSDCLSQHRLRGLESILETLENPKHGCSSPSPSHKSQGSSDNYSTDGKTTPQIKPETMAIINEFETMTRELLLARRSSVSYED